MSVCHSLILVDSNWIGFSICLSILLSILSPALLPFPISLPFFVQPPPKRLCMNLGVRVEILADPRDRSVGLFSCVVVVRFDAALTDSRSVSNRLFKWKHYSTFFYANQSMWNWKTKTGLLKELYICDKQTKSVKPFCLNHQQLVVKSGVDCNKKMKLSKRYAWFCKTIIEINHDGSSPIPSHLHFDHTEPGKYCSW